MDGNDHDDVRGRQVNHRKRNEQNNNQTEIDSNAYDQMRLDLSTPWLNEKSRVSVVQIVGNPNGSENGKYEKINMSIFLKKSPICVSSRRESNVRNVRMDWRRSQKSCALELTTVGHLYSVIGPYRLSASRTIASKLGKEPTVPGTKIVA